MRECIKQLFERQSKVALAMSPQSRASPMNLGLLDDCSRRAIQFGAPAYNRRDFDACYRMYFSLVRHIVSNYGDFPRATPLFRKAINYLRNSLAMAKNAQDDSRRVRTPAGFEFVFSLNYQIVSSHVPHRHGVFGTASTRLCLWCPHTAPPPRPCSIWARSTGAS